MDIKIEAPGHPNQKQLIKFYRERLEKKYGEYPFIHNLDVKITKEQNEYRVSLQIKPEKGKTLYAEEVHEKEYSALESVIKKMNSQIERYKRKHYHSANRRKIEIDSDGSVSLD